MGPPAVSIGMTCLLATSMELTFPSRRPTYTLRPSGAAASAVGVFPSGIAAATVLLRVSITLTELPSSFAT